MTPLFHKLDETHKSIEALLNSLDEQNHKPVHIGQAMEQALSLVETLCNFLNNKAVSTPDDNALVQAIEAADMDYQAKKEKYKLSIKDFEAHREKIEQADQIEKQHLEMKEKIASAKESLATAENRANELKEEHNQVVAQIKNWQETIVDIEEKHKKNVSVYQKHFEKNDQILKNISYAPAPPREALNTLSVEIKEKIEAFDKGLKNLITEIKDTSIEMISEVVKKDFPTTNEEDESAK